MKSLLWVLLPLISVIGCEPTGGVQVWEHIPDDQAKPLKGFYRNKGKEFLTYEQAQGYYAVSPQDMQYILDKLSQCMDPKHPSIQVSPQTYLVMLLGEE